MAKLTAQQIEKLGKMADEGNKAVIELGFATVARMRAEQAEAAYRQKQLALYQKAEQAEAAYSGAIRDAALVAGINLDDGGGVEVDLGRGLIAKEGQMPPKVQPGPDAPKGKRR